MSAPKSLALPADVRAQVEAFANGDKHGLRVLRWRGSVFLVCKPHPSQLGFTYTQRVDGLRLVHVLFVGAVALVRGMLPGGRGR